MPVHHAIPGFHSEPLLPFPYRVTERLSYWAQVHPNKTFLAQRDTEGAWHTLSYGAALEKTLAMAAFLLRQNPQAKPVAVIGSNSVHHALIGLGAMHVGMPYCPLSPLYVAKSGSQEKLKKLLAQLEPGITFSQDSSIQIKEWGATFPIPPVHGQWEAFEVNNPTAVQSAFQAIKPSTVAKVLFTSGSTGQPKGVINTHENITSNWQQLTQVFPFVKARLTLMDWLPWNHTYGGNHNLGLALFNGGTFYIDGGNPTPQGIKQTIGNLKTISPTVYFNVPRGFDALLPFLETDSHLRESFFRNLDMMFYAGASLSHPTWHKLEELSLRATGKRILIGAGLGSTETSPTALLQAQSNGFAGLLGLPVPGLELKLVAHHDKWEARYKGKNVFPGYWNQPDLTLEAFDAEGFYKSGDALKLADEAHPQKGFVFDGRLTEDFKLDSGTWVHSAVLRAAILEISSAWRDVVICGQDMPYVSAVLFPDGAWSDALKAKAEDTLRSLSLTSQGSSTRVKKAFLAAFEPNAATGELTEKGTVNARQLLKNHPEIMEALFRASHHPQVISLPD